MADTELPEYFVDSVLNVSHANGVFRLVLAQQEANNLQRSMVRVLIPANKLPMILQGVSNSVKEIGEKIRAQQSEAGDGTAEVEVTEGAGDEDKKGKGKK